MDKSCITINGDASTLCKSEVLPTHIQSNGSTANENHTDPGRKFVGCRTKIKPVLRKLFLTILACACVIFVGFAWKHDRSEATPLLIFVGLLFGGLIYYKVVKPIVFRRNSCANFGSWTDKVVKNVQKHAFAKYIFYGTLMLTIAAFIIYDTRENRYRLMPLCGITLVLFIAVAISTNPTKINWRPVIWGFSLQFAMGLVSLKWPMGLNAFGWLSRKIVTFLDYTTYGTNFVYGFLSKPPNICSMGPVFVFTVLQVIIYFGSVVALLYYFGIIQFVLRRLAKLLQITMGTTAAESFYAVGCIVLGQSEAPILIAPYLSKMTRSELNTIMTTGFSCIAGAVFAAYVALGACPYYILSACIMSSPASVAVSKILLPETEESQLKNESDLKLPKSHERNFIEAISHGASSVIGVVACITANLIVFLALLYFVDDAVKFLASLVGLEIGFQNLLGYVFFPFAFAMGVSDRPDWDARMNETLVVAQLMGTKTVLNEFIAYENMGQFILNGELSNRAQMMTTYALCSFSNCCSIGVQMGILGSLCPEKKGVIAQTILRALVGGCICCIITACVAGILVDVPFVCPPKQSSLNCTVIN